VQCFMLSGAYAPADLALWLGENRRHAGRHGEDFQRRHGDKDAAHKCRSA
jgi:hypothetical protein